MKENDNLEETWKMIQEKYPLVHFTGSSRLYTMVRRMQAEKKYGIPVELRSGFAVSVKTGKNANPANTNMPWGKGDTPVADILKLVQKNKWPIYFDIELEYPVPAASDAQKEVVKCVQFCEKILV